ncbi:MAG: hypothetical protein QF486_01405 [Candidatus Woesearchaeota archaeon]|jgi:hypothetical protein|nr:hypothetical protein [Candidatus Woesearchaeota archaeon]MDP7181129.1 hypothetical protein [Candidatus Woesearchaeota archaeon]MDP7198250.1 hypothetical protein [Candidatus Woesearchaeota archaeon]MDP7467086.1 hypothetical protein [Candidatus Woesearchaeota archaeon]MDP7646754.1 hypothetical protein [Candidatus Woesearchaeota archaeon]|tara:strand:- start:1267 stop:1842 length:576 start_codon:yes stop_codon:yes gene_type:complete
MPDLTIARLNGNSNEFSDVLKGLEGLDHAIAFVYHRGNFKDWETSDMVKRVELNALVVCEYSEESGSWTVYQGQDVQAGTNLEDRRRISNDFPEVDIGAYTQPNDMFGSLKGDAVPAVVAFPSGPRQRIYRFVGKAVETFGHREGQKVAVVPVGRKDPISVLERHANNYGFSYAADSKPNGARIEHVWELG